MIVGFSTIAITRNGVLVQDLERSSLTREFIYKWYSELEYLKFDTRQRKSESSQSWSDGLPFDCGNQSVIESLNYIYRCSELPSKLYNY